LVGAKNPTGQTVLLKKVFLHKLDLFYFFTLSTRQAGLISLLSNAVVVCRPLSSFPLVVRRPILRALSSDAVIVCRCHCSPLPLLSSATIVVRHHHLLPLQPSLPLCVSLVSCHPLSSFPFIVHRPILHAVDVCCCCCPSLLLLSAAAVFRRRSHHHHSPVSAISHHPLSSFPIAVRRPIKLVVIVRHHHHLPPLLSAVTVPPLILPPTRC
jgi:hypothetical protein